MSSITTVHGTFSYEHDGCTVSESPDQNEYMVYWDDEQIGSIILSYDTSKSLSNRYGWTDVRGSRNGWSFVQFDHYILPHQGHPSSAINMEFHADEFHNIKGAFKECVRRICEHVDTLDTVIINGMARQAEVCHCGRLIVSHDHDEIFACFMELHLAGIPDAEHDDLVEVKE
jgi:hypothetical protein